jgi:hypothetical protein
MEDGGAWIGLKGMQGGEQSCPAAAQDQDIRADDLDRWLSHSCMLIWWRCLSYHGEPTGASRQP